MNNFISVDFQTHVSIWFLISKKFCNRIINKKRGVRKCNSAMLIGLFDGFHQKLFTFTFWLLTSLKMS